MLVFKFFIFTAVLYIVVASNDELELINEVESDFFWTRSPKTFSQHIKYSLNQPESRFITRTCFVDLLKYGNSLIKLNIWAIKMFDATGKIPSGLLRGYASNLGNFDECIGVISNRSLTSPIKGKYCLGRWTVANFNKYIELPFNPFNKPKSINVVNGTFSMEWGICIPDSCKAKDFNFILSLLRVKFSEDTCQTKAQQLTVYDNLDNVAVAIFVTFTVLLLVCTLYHVLYSVISTEPPSMVSNLISSFSLVKNLTAIIETEEEAHVVSCIHGIRVISFIGVMAGFRLIVLIFAPVLNWLDLVDWILDKNLSALIDLFIFGDTFLIISGFLIAHNYLKLKDGGGKFNLIVYYANRIIRIFPALAMVVLLHSSLLRHFGSGPVWPACRDTNLVDKCREYWWSSLLFVQNYVNPGLTNVCILQTWQLSLDMQLFILSPILLYPLSKHPKYTISFIILLIVGSITSSFLVAWVYQLKAVFRNTRSLDDINRYLEFFYFPIHTRATPWLIGFITGYIGFEWSKKDIKKKPIQYFGAGILWIISISVLVFCVMIGRFVMTGKYNWVDNAFHIALIRPFWTLAICWIIFACMQGYIVPVNQVLSAGVFRTISKITYSSYLINVSLMFIMTCQTRHAYEFGVWTASSMLFSDIVACLSIGFLWALMFEYPFRGVAKSILSGTKYVIQQTRKTKKDHEEP